MDPGFGLWEGNKEGSFSSSAVGGLDTGWGGVEVTGVCVCKGETSMCVSTAQELQSVL